MSNSLPASTGRFSRLDLAALVLRLGLAVIFIYHGWDKIQPGPESDWGTGWMERHYRLRTTREMTEAEREIAEKPARGPADPFFRFVQATVAWGELVGGVALVLGLLTRLAALCLMATQIGAIFSITSNYGFSSARRLGYEYNVALIIMCLALLLLGAGGIAVDRYFRRRAPSNAPRPTEPISV
jgi:putative oxidoreductase